MRPLVMKFGGSSVADAACLREVGALVAEALPSAPIVVLSAMGKTTNQLFDAAQRAAKGDGDAASTQRGDFFRNTEPGKMKNLMPRAPRYSPASSPLMPTLPSSPAMSARCSCS